MLSSSLISSFFYKPCSNLGKIASFQNAIPIFQWPYKLYLLIWCLYFFPFSLRGEFEVFGICRSNILLLSILTLRYLKSTLFLCFIIQSYLSCQILQESCAMCHIHGCPENFRDSLTTPIRLLFPTVFTGFC